MVKYRLSAFSDEYSPVLEEQIEGLVKNRIRMMELRGVDGTNVADLTPAQVLEVKKKLEASGIALSAIASPIGKIGVGDPIGPHLHKLRHVLETAVTLGVDRVRVFSFYIPEGEDPESFRETVLDRVGRMVEMAEEYEVLLCHENEKGIYGDTPERCLQLLRTFDGRLGCVFDPANFVQSGCDSFEAYRLLAPYLTYLHIKDADRHGTVVPAGFGLGSLPEILAVLNHARTGEMILTVEPHLRVFPGSDTLEKHSPSTRSMAASTYPSNRDAFETAVHWTRACLPNNCEHEF